MTTIISNRLWHKPRLKGLLGVVVVALTVTACERRESEDLGEWIRKTLAENRSYVPDIQPVPESKAKIYDVAHLRDPFLSRVEKRDLQDNSRPEPPTTRPPEFLESYKLTDLKLVGVMIGGAKADALIEDPEGQVHAVKVGDHLGESYGRVHRIFADGLDLYEQVLNEDRKWVLRITRMYVETDAP